MQSAEQTTTPAQAARPAHNERKNKLARCDVLVCGILIITANQSIYLDEVQQLPDRICDTATNVATNAAPMDNIQSPSLQDRVVVKDNNNSVTNKINFTMQEIVDAFDWKGEGTDPTKPADDIRQREEVSVLTNAVVHGLLTTNEEAWNKFDEAIYKSLADPSSDSFS